MYELLSPIIFEEGWIDSYVLTTSSDDPTLDPHMAAKLSEFKKMYYDGNFNGYHIRFDDKKCWNEARSKCPEGNIRHNPDALEKVYLDYHDEMNTHLRKVCAFIDDLCFKNDFHIALTRQENCIEKCHFTPMPREPELPIEQTTLFYDQALVSRRSGVYFVKETLGKIKIGYASNFISRLGSHVCSNPHPLTMIAVKITNGDRNYENYFHRKYKKYHHHGEWFSLPDNITSEIMYEMTWDEKQTCILCNQYLKKRYSTEDYIPK